MDGGYLPGRPALAGRAAVKDPQPRPLAAAVGSLPLGFTDRPETDSAAETWISLAKSPPWLPVHVRRRLRRRPFARHCYAQHPPPPPAVLGTATAVRRSTAPFPGGGGPSPGRRWRLGEGLSGSGPGHAGQTGRVRRLGPSTTGRRQIRLAAGRDH